jgi:hypothetical protein
MTTVIRMRASAVIELAQAQIKKHQTAKTEAKAAYRYERFLHHQQDTGFLGWRRLFDRMKTIPEAGRLADLDLKESMELGWLDTGGLGEHLIHLRLKIGFLENLIAVAGLCHPGQLVEIDDETALKLGAEAHVVDTKAAVKAAFAAE